MKVAISGATGFVGKRLVEKLHLQGHHILVLTRNVMAAQKSFSSSQFPNVEMVAYTPSQSGDWQQSIAGCDGVVNLAGEPIAEGRWTAARKQEILHSRKLGTQKIVEAIALANPKPQVLVNASAIGYYGTSENATFDEKSAAGNDFLAQVCLDWEAEAQKVTSAGVRLVIIRLGIVLGKGGALDKMVTPFKLFAGGPIGTGKQWFSWIHRDDLVNMIIQALTRPDISGVLNGTAPNPVRMNELSQTMGQVMNRPSWLPVPSLAIEALLGDGAIVVLEGQQVVPQCPLDYNFDYQYPTLTEALKDILGNG